MHPIVRGMVFLFIAIPHTVFGHEDGTPFSGAIIDPLKVHHAHIENEQRINSSFIDGLPQDDGGTRRAFTNSVELGINWTDEFNIGSEVLIPFSNTGARREDYNIGDIELWPVKYAVINEPETILTGVFSVGLPTGSESKGLGEGNTALGALFFFDHSYRNWFWGVNTEIETNVFGRTGTELELASVISYSFIRDTGAGMAPTKPAQFLVPALSLEIISESVLRGDEKGENVVSLLPGLSLWHPQSGWTVRIGVESPVSAEKEHNVEVLFQIGNHLNWGELFR